MQKLSLVEFPFGRQINLHSNVVFVFLAVQKLRLNVHWFARLPAKWEFRQTQVTS